MTQALGWVSSRVFCAGGHWVARKCSRGWTSLFRWCTMSFTWSRSGRIPMFRGRAESALRTVFQIARHCFGTVGCPQLAENVLNV